MLCEVRKFDFIVSLLFMNHRLSVIIIINTQTTVLSVRSFKHWKHLFSCIQENLKSFLTNLRDFLL